MQNNGIEFEVLVKNKPITEYTKDGKFFVEGRKDSEYTLRIKNNTYSRVLAIPSVDGLSVVDGNKASYNSRGYILEPYATYEVDGWRINNDEVRKFFFSKHEKSYSNKTGQGEDNLGAIGLVVYREKYVPPKIIYHYNDWPYNWTTKTYGGCFGGSSYQLYNATGDINAEWLGANSLDREPVVAASTAKSAARSVKQEDVTQTIGTGMGEKAESKVTTASFEKEASPFAVLSMFYYERKQLEQMGIIHKAAKNLPSAFPGEFCKEV
jgi:hypothetical protein